MTSKKKKASTAADARRVSKIRREWKSEHKMAMQVNHTPFIPPAIVGRRFVKCALSKQREHHNWFGYDAFTVLGDLGPRVIPGHDVYDGKSYIFPASVLVETEHVPEGKDTPEKGIMHISRSEFVDLVMEFYDPA